VRTLALLVVFVMIAFVGPAAAQPAAEACAAIADDIERLGCYDAIFRNTGNLPEGDVVIESERLIPALPTGRAPATMVVSCASGKPVVAFSFAGQLVSNTGDIAPVTFQLDQNGTVVRTLSANDSNTALQFEPGSASEAFLNSLAGGTNLKVRMTPVRQRSLTVDFRLPEHEQAIGALREGCR
jgi:type VI secretion system protein VasI